MPVCPSCQAEYREGFARCAACDVALVTPEELAAAAKEHAPPREFLADKKKVLIPQANLGSCRELETALLHAEIPCYTHVEEADADVALGSSAMLQYAVVLAEDDVERAKAAMKDRFQSMIEQEGLGSFQTDAIDLDSGEVTCPACGHSGALKEGECEECGLFLGAPE